MITYMNGMELLCDLKQLKNIINKMFSDLKGKEVIINLYDIVIYIEINKDKQIKSVIGVIRRIEINNFKIQRNKIIRYFKKVEEKLLLE